MGSVVAIVGRSKSGKTTLIEKLIKNFKGKDYKVAVLKHTLHDFEMDHKGKDSYRFKEAGAVSTVVTNDRKIAFVSDLKEAISPDEIINKYIAEDIDLVLAEGFKNAGIPMIEVVGDNSKLPLYKTGEYNISAVVTDNEIKTELPLYKRNDIEKISMLIEEKYIKRK